MEYKIQDTIVKVVEAGIPVMLTGPSGIGKTYTAMNVARKVSPTGDIIIVDAGTLSEPEDWFTKPVISREGIDWVPSRLVIDTQSPIVIDEINRVQNERVLNAVLPILDFRKSLWIERLQMEVSFENRPIIATANIGFEFVGTVQLDAALLNRFAIIDIERPEFASKYPFVARVAASVRDCGFRNIEIAERLIDAGIPERDAIYMAFRSVCEPEELKQIIRMAE